MPSNILTGMVGITLDRPRPPCVQTDLGSAVNALLENIQKRISLGLDLSGGAHLVLQVNVYDAINAEADQTIERLKQTLDQRQVTYAAITRIDAKEITDDGGIRVEGGPPGQNRAFREAMEWTGMDWAAD